MSDERIKDVGHIKWLWEQVTKIWFVSILLMAFTFLAQLDRIKSYSAYLSYAISIWRDFIHGAIEFPVNVMLEVFKLEQVDLQEPIPEIITFFALFVFCVFREKKLLTHPYTKWIDQYWISRKDAHQKENSRILKLALFIEINSIKLLIGMPAFIVMAILLREKPLLILPIFFAILLLDKYSKLFRKAVSLYAYPLSHFILLTAAVLVISSVALEKIIPMAEKFKSNATESSRLNIPQSKQGNVPNN